MGGAAHAAISRKQTNQTKQTMPVGTCCFGCHCMTCCPHSIHSTLMSTAAKSLFWAIASCTSQTHRCDLPHCAPAYWPAAVPVKWPLPSDSSSSSLFPRNILSAVHERILAAIVAIQVVSVNNNNNTTLEIVAAIVQCAGVAHAQQIPLDSRHRGQFIDLLHHTILANLIIEDKHPQ
ncbi:hypothetical protein BGW36DRAFT_118110 [Talaromyces proteolyticus]|uniref:Uncharacterized protein n=1 Tax=Talaromyces proteolyticus TaxID=1131652 RepID=A0AAD4Q4C1_9EURO|nr:uncharacterized protein BGW36DRAFT_118110 [Talaromyces proteolyticus]KAH8702517.1 hypothetical protein BGW36DRAFT_118110 [Talaromyces proteolyticus]